MTDCVLVAECVEGYLPIEASQREAFERLLESEPYAEIRAMNKTTSEKVFEKVRLDNQELALAIYRDKFGATPAIFREKTDHMPEHELRALILRLSVANSPEQAELPK